MYNYLLQELITDNFIILILPSQFHFGKLTIHFCSYVIIERRKSDQFIKIRTIAIRIFKWASETKFRKIWIFCVVRPDKACYAWIFDRTSLQTYFTTNTNIIRKENTKRHVAKITLSPEHFSLSKGDRVVPATSTLSDSIAHRYNRTPYYFSPQRSYYV